MIPEKESDWWLIMHLLHNMTLAQAGCPTMAVRFLEPYADLDCCLKLNFTAAVPVPTCLLVEVRVSEYIAQFSFLPTSYWPAVAALQ